MANANDGPIGVIGIGIMGSAMVGNLVASGYRVVGYDVAPTAMSALVERGGAPAQSVADLAAQAEIVVTSLPSVAALRDVVAALKQARGQTRILVETSTLALADKMAAHADLADVGIVVLDCPLSGTGTQARTRDIVVYASGDKPAFNRCKPVLGAFSRRPHYLGAFGAGTKMKMIANLLVAIHTAAAGEAFALARKAGLDPADTLEMITAGAGSSRSLEARGEMLVADQYLPLRTMPLNLWRKDLRVISDFAADLGCPVPMFGSALPLFTAAVAMGLGDHDTAAVAKASASLSGLAHP